MTTREQIVQTIAELTIQQPGKAAKFRWLTALQVSQQLSIKKPMLLKMLKQLVIEKQLCKIRWADGRWLYAAKAAALRPVGWQGSDAGHHGKSGKLNGLRFSSPTK